MTEELLEKFRKDFCWFCGTQRCTSEGEWLEACPEYRKFVKEYDRDTES